MRRRVFRIRGDRSGFAPIVAEMLLVAVTITLAGSLYFMLTAVVSSAGAFNPSFVALRVADSQHSTGSGLEYLNDSFIQIIDATGEPLPWVQPQQFQIWAADWSQLLIQGDLEIPFGPRYTGVYHSSEAEPSIVSVSIIDQDANGRVTGGDTIQVLGMSKEYHEAHFKILMPQNQFTVIDLP